MDSIKYTIEMIALWDRVRDAFWQCFVCWAKEAGRDKYLRRVNFKRK